MMMVLVFSCLVLSKRHHKGANGSPFISTENHVQSIVYAEGFAAYILLVGQHFLNPGHIQSRKYICRKCVVGTK